MIIGINGKKGSGKDTIGEYLVDNYGFTRLSFADALKRMCSDLYNIDLDCFYNVDLKEVPLVEHNNKTPRWVLQNTAELFRQIEPDYWVKSVISQVKNGNNYVICDLRHKNEVDYLDVTMKVVRENTPYNNEDDHISENDLNDFNFDIVIQNDDSLTDLYKKIDYIMKKDEFIRNFS